MHAQVLWNHIDCRYFNQAKKHIWQILQVWNQKQSHAFVCYSQSSEIYHDIGIKIGWIIEL